MATPPSKAPLADGMQHAVNGIVNQLLKKHNHRDWTFYESIMGFVSAVDWSEKWIIGLVTLHICLLFSVVFFRKNINCQTVLFGIMCAIIFFLERLNSYGRRHWRDFSSQNYFDEHGVFIGGILAAPIFVILTLQLALWLWLLKDMLI